VRGRWRQASKNVLLLLCCFLILKDWQELCLLYRKARRGTFFSLPSLRPNLFLSYYHITLYREIIFGFYVRSFFNDVLYNAQAKRQEKRGKAYYKRYLEPDSEKREDDADEYHAPRNAANVRYASLCENEPLQYSYK